MEYEKALNITEKRRKIEVDVKPKNWLHKQLIRLRIAKAKYEFEVSSPTLATRIKYNAIIEDIDFDKCLDKSGIDSALNEGLRSKIIQGLAVVIHNKPTEPQKDIIDALESLTEAELFAMAKVIEALMDVGFFLNFLILAHQMKLPTMKNNSTFGSGEAR